MQTPAHHTLSAWQPGPDAAPLHREYVAFAADAATEFRESSVAEHLTASAFVFNANRDRVLLSFHRKGQFWVQFGGHIEPQDASLFDAAAREGAEESGISTLEPITTAPVDLDRHALASAFGTCRVHWDVGFAFVAPHGAAAVVSDESEDVAWWPVDALPATAVAGLDGRIARVLAALG